MINGVNPSIQNYVDDSFLRPNDFCKKLGISRSLLYSCIREGKIPKPIKQGQRVSLWPMSVVNDIVDKIKGGELCLGKS